MIFQTKRKLEPFVSLLDVGTTKVCALVVKVAGDKPEVIGAGVVPAKGIKAGAIIDLDAATDSIQTALAEADRQADYQTTKVVVNVSSTQLKSQHIYQEMDIVEGRPITTQDVRHLVDRIVSDHLDEDDELLHTFPLGYVVDKEKGCYDPRDLYGKRLGAHVHMVTLPETQLKNLVAVLDRCHVSIETKVATPYAAALAVLSEEEKELGATVIDFGGGTTSYALFMSGGLVHLGNVPIGGKLMTRDIAQGLSTSQETAERLKTLNGAAFLSPKDELERLIVPLIGEEDEASIQIPRATLISMIVPRLEQILEAVGAQITEEARFQVATRRLVLTGGGASLEGIKEKTAALLGANVRFGKPTSIKNLPNQYDSYTFATCVGLLMYVLMHSTEKPSVPLTVPPRRKGLLGKGLQWLIQNF